MGCKKAPCIPSRPDCHRFTIVIQRLPRVILIFCFFSAERKDALPSAGVTSLPAIFQTPRSISACVNSGSSSYSRSEISCAPTLAISLPKFSLFSFICFPHRINMASIAMLNKMGSDPIFCGVGESLSAASWPWAADKSGDQGHQAHLPAGVTMPRRVERNRLGQRVVRVKMLTRPKQAGALVL